MPSSAEFYAAASRVSGSSDEMGDLGKVHWAESNHGVVNCGLERTVMEAFELIGSLQQGAAGHLEEVAALLRQDGANEAIREEERRLAAISSRGAT